MPDFFFPKKDTGRNERTRNDSDRTVAERFALLGKILDVTQSSGDSRDQRGESEQILLLLSSCRNCYLTLNSIFITVSKMFADGKKPAPMAEVLFHFEKGDFLSSPRRLQEIGSLRAEARLKLRVWEKRESLWQRWQEAINTFKTREPLLLPRIESFEDALKSVPILVDGVQDKGVFLKIDIESEPPPIRDLIEQLRQVIDRVEPIELLVREFGRLAVLHPEINDSEQDLLGFGDSISEEEWRTSYAVLDDVCKRLAWSGGDENGDGEIRLIDQSINDARCVSLSISSLPPTFAKFKRYAHVLTGWLLSERRLLIKEIHSKFRPNAVSRPLPPPFVIDLDLTTPDSHGVAEKPRVDVLYPLQPFEMRRRPEDVRISVARCPVPISCYTESYYYEYKDDSLRDDAGQAALLCIRESARQGANIVVFPEFFLPRPQEGSPEILTRLVAEAESKGIVLVGGLEGMRDENGQLHNEAVIALPGVSKPLIQSKQLPSVYEPEGNSFFADGVLKVFKGTSCGNFAVLLCSDYREIDVLYELNNANVHLDLLIVCGLNPYPEHYKLSAAADAARFYCHVILAQSKVDLDDDKVATSEGTLVASPWRAADCIYVDGEEGERESGGESTVVEVEVASPGSNKNCSLLITDVSLGALDRRDRPRQAKGFLPAPYSQRPRKSPR